jgi:putative Mg2+ transporter-C (MgtC) family protein
VPDLSGYDIVLRLVLAGVLGGAVGLERELREREAGLRTHLLVSVGAALFTLVSAYAWTDFDFGFQSGVTFDPTRIAAQIVTGIGFLGAGAIIRQGLSVRGLTTAATLWVVAAIGMASGAGYWEAAVVTTVLVLLSLWPLRIVAHRVLERIQPEQERRLLVELEGRQSAAPLLSVLDDLDVRVRSFQLEDERGRREIVLGVELPGEGEPERMVARISELEEVVGVRWSE